MKGKSTIGRKPTRRKTTKSATGSTVTVKGKALKKVTCTGSSKTAAKLSAALRKLGHKAATRGTCVFAS